MVAPCPAFTSTPQQRVLPHSSPAIGLCVQGLVPSPATFLGSLLLPCASVSPATSMAVLLSRAGEASWGCAELAGKPGCSSC